MSQTWWDSPEWNAYEVAYGDTQGDRSKLLKEASWSTRIIDLSQSEAELWRGVRQSYHAMINKLTRDATTTIEMVNAFRYVPTGDALADYVYASDQWLRVGAWDGAIQRARVLHHKAAGRDTRPKATWDCQARWLEQGRAVLAVCRQDATDVAFAFVVTHGNWAYYFNAASLIPNAQHAIQWAVMLYLKRRGIRWYEIGWQGCAANAKEANIEFFKRGFGGEDCPARWVFDRA